MQTSLANKGRKKLFLVFGLSVIVVMAIRPAIVFGDPSLDDPATEGKIVAEAIYISKHQGFKVIARSVRSEGHGNIDQCS